MLVLVDVLDHEQALPQPSHRYDAANYGHSRFNMRTAHNAALDGQVLLVGFLSSTFKEASLCHILCRW